MSVTLPIVPVPDCFVIVTVDPPLVRLLPFASLACTVNTCVLLPLAVTLALVGVSVDCVASAAPGLITIVELVPVLPPVDVAVSVMLSATLSFVLIVNVPHPVDPRPAYTSGLLRVHAWRSRPTAPGDAWWDGAPEARRAYLNSADYCAARGL